MHMPPSTFFVLIATVVAFAGVTIAVWTLAGLPLVALGAAALCSGLILGWRGLRR
jgi:EamA domain-containing membrane protein RarD